MTEDLDRVLRDRLGTLATAVPVEPEGLLGTPVSRRVRLASTGRGFSIGGVVSVVLVVAVASLIAGIAHVGPFAPGQTPSAVSLTTSDGPFELTLTSAKSRYELGEAIDVKATLTYRGQEASVSISHGHGSPMAFGVVERVDGLFLTPAWRQSCERSVLERNVALERPFAKSGSFSGDNPAATDASGFFTDPTLVLPTGIWHLYVVADFGVGDCGQDRHLMRVDLEIGVQVTPEGTPDASPSIVPPAPQPTLQPTEGPVVGRATDGPYELELRSARGTYHESDPIDIVGAFTYAGNVAIDVSGFWPLDFSVDEPVYGFHLSWIHTLMCTNHVLLPDYRVESPFAKGGAISGNEPNAAFHRAYLDDPVFRLPPGTWHVRVGASLTEGKCIPPPGGTHSLSAVVEIVVLPDPAATPGIPVPTDPPVYGEDDDGLAILQLRSSHASYAEGIPIELEAKYWFADGPALVASHYEPELLLSIIQLDASNPTARGTSYDNACTDLGRVDGTERQVALAGYNIAQMRADRVPARLEDLFVGGALVLPVGRWEINANVEGRFAPCGQAGDGYALSASIVIEVVPG